MRIRKAGAVAGIAALTLSALAWCQPTAPAAPCSCDDPDETPAAAILPGYPIGACTASGVKGSITGFTNGFAGADCMWQMQWTCASLTQPACVVCWEVEWDYLSAVTGGWVVAPGGINTGQKNGVCGWSYTTNFDSTYIYPAPPAPPAKDPMPPGTTMRVTVRAGAWVAADGPGCNGVGLNDLGSKVFIR